MVVTRAALLVLILAGTTACALVSRGRTEAPLELPPPPPRVFVPAEDEPLAAQAPPVDDEPVKVTPDAPSPRVPRSALRPAAPKPARSDPPPAPPPASPPPEEPAPQRTLQTTAGAADLEKRIRDLLANAVQNLNRVDVRALSANAKAQYDAARRFNEQAEDALRAKNLVFAEQLANKAAELAALLVKR